MPLPEEEVSIHLRDLIADNFNTGAITEEFKKAWISTDWYTEDNDIPEITVNNIREPTDPDAFVPDGSGLSSWVDGSGQINVWVDYDRDTFDSIGGAKQMRWELTREVYRVIEQNQQGTTDSSGDPYLTRLTTGEIRRNPAEEPPPFRMLIPVAFQYRAAPS